MGTLKDKGRVAALTGVPASGAVPAMASG